MEYFFQEFSGFHGTLVKPYYWLYHSQHCSRCPYHIRTGEESRVTYGEFYQAFGFPYGPTNPENKQLTFYEIKDFTGRVLQKGHATNCNSCNIHVESILFEEHGYLDFNLYCHQSVGYLTLYSNYTPCDEYAHCCATKMNDFLIRYPQIRMDIYFSQLYHVDENNPSSLWNREALRTLAGHWSRVTVNPISNRIWQTILYDFVREVPAATLHQPILPARASADSYNAYMIHLITGVKPYFVDVPPEPKAPVVVHRQDFPTVNANHISVPQPQHGSYPYIPVLGPSVPIRPVPIPAYHGGHIGIRSKPKQVVRHLNMPTDRNQETDLEVFLPNARKMNEVVVTEKVVKKKGKDKREKKKKKKRERS
uniref:Apolipoprotein B mRNA editing enzyme catalytic polypeptide like 4 n=1 Tax=Leptobrachium leishanense TaxID=445787 RepID=A0A8C5PDE1_9ANUR